MGDILQIGPKIKIGGTIGAIGQSVKEGVGKVAKVAALPASFFNPALGAALAAGGKALDTTDGGSSVGDLAMAGAKTYGMGKVVGGIPGVGTLASKIPGGSKVAGVLGSVGGHTPFDEKLPEQITFDANGNVVPGAASSGGGILDGIKSIGRFALDNPDVIGGAVAGYNGFKAGQQSDALRQQAIAAMNDRPDLSSIFAGAGRGNPYSKYAATGALARRG